QQIIDGTRTVAFKTFLVPHLAKPYTAPGFGNWFRELCDQAGCPDVSAHGLRKAAGRRLAEIGCSANQTAAILGHASLTEVQRYTKAADRKRMAREAMAKLIEGGWGTDFCPLGISLDNFGAKALRSNDSKQRMVGPGGLEPPTRPL